MKKILKRKKKIRSLFFKSKRLDTKKRLKKLDLITKLDQEMGLYN